MCETPVNLDSQFFETLTKENLKSIFELMISKKTKVTDTTDSIVLRTGSDGISQANFTKNFDTYCDIIIEKCKSGHFLFHPFRETEKEKPPYTSLAEAKRAGKIRVLSIASIQDTMVQNLLYEVITPTMENTFKSLNIHNHSFAYRKNKSANHAVQFIQQDLSKGYHYVLNGDIQKFFDKIDHTLMKEKLDRYFDPQSVVGKLLYRFLHVNRISPDTHNQHMARIHEFNKQKKSGKYNPLPKKCPSEKRTIGIPQGGVLSGLLANLFLMDFDNYVCNTLKTLVPDLDFKYYRYADDFVLLFKDPQQLQYIFYLISNFLEEEKLTLHPLFRYSDSRPDGFKCSELLYLTPENGAVLNFLGYEISPTHLRIKEDNFNKFVNRFEKDLVAIGEQTSTYRLRLEKGKTPPEKIQDYVERFYLRRVGEKTAFRFVGMEIRLCKEKFGYCDYCHRLIPHKNWMGYFAHITDPSQLQALDKQLKSSIHAAYRNYFNKPLTRKKYAVLSQENPIWKNHHKLLSVEHCFYAYKQLERVAAKKDTPFCDCEFITESKDNSFKIVVRSSSYVPENVTETSNVIVIDESLVDTEVDV